MPGHFYIHLFFSRSYGKGRVSPRHLESVGQSAAPALRDEGSMEAQ